MSEYTENSSRFIDATQVGDLEKAVAAAEGMRDAAGDIGIRRSLELVVLMAHRGDERTERAGARWLEYLARVGCDPQLVDIARAALPGLPSPKSGTAWRSEKILMLIASSVFPA